MIIRAVYLIYIDKPDEVRGIYKLAVILNDIKTYNNDNK
jgi:hypothetical protein